ncbi:hypothetical protein [Citrobacter koseri]|uniref:hypothetical protein n=1 Tax=Citrobacter koseri TaxID=545 RepID=UPI002161137F|nr:hypothetical protein [Citrobacter koseri]
MEIVISRVAAAEGDIIAVRPFFPFFTITPGVRRKYGTANGEFVLRFKGGIAKFQPVAVLIFQMAIAGT